MIKLSKIKPHPDNPRLIKDERFQKLVKSIEEFPKMLKIRPIIVGKDNVILAGNMRYKALKHLGWKEIPEEWVKCADELTEEEKKRFIIADNVGFGQWDWDMLANDWDENELMDWGLDVPGFEALDVDDLEDSFNLPDGDKSPFQQVTFTLADTQAERLQEALKEAKKENKADKFGNENSNGNALYRIICEWSELKTDF